MEEGVKFKVGCLFRAVGERNLSEVMQLCDPGVRFRALVTELACSGQAYIGQAGLREYFTELERGWDELELTAAEVREVDGAVLVLGRVVARSKDEGTRDLPAGWVLRLSGDRFVYGRGYSDPRQAERELGAEPDAHPEA